MSNKTKINIKNKQAIAIAYYEILLKKEYNKEIKLTSYC